MCVQQLQHTAQVYAHRRRAAQAHLEHTHALRCYCSQPDHFNKKRNTHSKRRSGFACHQANSVCKTMSSSPHRQTVLKQSNVRTYLCHASLLQGWALLLPYKVTASSVSSAHASSTRMQVTAAPAGCTGTLLVQPSALSTVFRPAPPFVLGLVLLKQSAAARDPPRSPERSPRASCLAHTSSSMLAGLRPASTLGAAVLSSASSSSSSLSSCGP